VDNPSEDVQAQIESARAKRYSVYAVWDRDNESKGVQIFIVAHWFFQNNVMGICKKPRSGGVVAFADPSAEEGRSIAFEIAGSKTQQQWKSFQFSEREEDIPDDIIEAVPTLDELLDIPTYEQVKKAFWAGLSEEESLGNEPEPGLSKRMRKPTSECPMGGVIGRDFENFQECLTSCEKYVKCQEVYEDEFAETQEDSEEPAEEPDDTPDPESVTPPRTPRRSRR